MVSLLKRIVGKFRKPKPKYDRIDNSDLNELLRKAIEVAKDRNEKKHPIDRKTD